MRGDKCRAAKLTVGAFGPVRAGCVLMTVQHRGYSGAADPKLCFYSYRPDGSAWVCAGEGQRGNEVCRDQILGEKALVSARHPLDQDS